jgi:integrase
VEESRPTAISRSDVREILDRIVARGSKVAANRVRALISKIYSFGLQRELVDHNPVVGVAKPTGEESRERVLTDDEIRRVWAACETQNDWVAAWFRLRLVTAQRGGELLQMRWQDIDASGAWWTIPASSSRAAEYIVCSSTSARSRSSAPFRATKARCGYSHGQRWVIISASDDGSRRLRAPTSSRVPRPLPGRAP